jgi:hypothetical protein
VVVNQILPPAIIDDGELTQQETDDDERFEQRKFSNLIDVVVL